MSMICQYSKQSKKFNEPSLQYNKTIIKFKNGRLQLIKCRLVNGTN